MTRDTTRLSRLMRISWDIQRRRKYNTRSKALSAAWAIVNNEEVTVHYLVRKLNREKPINWQTEKQFALFNR